MKNFTRYISSHFAAHLKEVRESYANVDQVETITEVSFRMDYKIAKMQKPHTIEELIKPCITESVSRLLGGKASSTME